MTLQEYTNGKSCCPKKWSELNRTLFWTDDCGTKSNLGQDKIRKRIQHWVFCDHYDCMQVYDVTNFSDTQRNEFLTNHHMVGVKTLQGKGFLHHTRLGKITDSDAKTLKNNMSIPRLTQLHMECG